MVTEYLPIIIMSAVGLGIGIWMGKAQRKKRVRQNKRGKHRNRAEES